MNHLSVCLVCICCLSSVWGEAQQLKTIKQKHPPHTRTIEEYQVLKQDEKVKHGFYRKFVSRKLVESGFYADNMKDSIWTFFSQTGVRVAHGRYAHDSLSGVWTYFAQSGIRVQQYDHDLDSMIYFNTAEEKKRAYAPDSFPDHHDERMPLFIGGNYYMSTILENNLVYPSEAWDNNLNAKVIISFTVDKTGNTINIESKYPAGHGFDEEGIRLISLLGKGWLPGIHEGKPVPVGFTMPITFYLR